MNTNPVLSQATETRNPNRTMERIHGLERDKRRRLIKLAKRNQSDPRQKLASGWLLGYEDGETRSEKHAASVRYLGLEATDELCNELSRRAIWSPRPGEIWVGEDEEDGQQAWLLIRQDADTGTWLGLSLLPVKESRFGTKLDSEEPCGEIALCMRAVGIRPRLKWRIGFIRQSTLRSLQLAHTL